MRDIGVRITCRRRDFLKAGLNEPFFTLGGIISMAPAQLPQEQDCIMLFGFNINWLSRENFDVLP